jgi:hypothetical protein
LRSLCDARLRSLCDARLFVERRDERRNRPKLAWSQEGMTAAGAVLRLANSSLRACVGACTSPFSGCALSHTARGPNRKNGVNCGNYALSLDKARLRGRAWPARRVACMRRHGCPSDGLPATPRTRSRFARAGAGGVCGTAEISRSSERVLYRDFFRDCTTGGDFC